MFYFGYFNERFLIVDSVNDAIVANSRHSLSPPLSFLHPGGRGVTARSSIALTIRAMRGGESRSISFPALGLMESLYTPIELAAFHKTRLKLRKWNAVFRIPLARVKHVLQVFPQLAVDRQINLDRDPFSMFIGDKLNSSHISIMPQSEATEVAAFASDPALLAPRVANRNLD